MVEGFLFLFCLMFVLHAFLEEPRIISKFLKRFSLKFTGNLNLESFDPNGDFNRLAQPISSEMETLNYSVILLVLVTIILFVLFANWYNKRRLGGVCGSLLRCFRQCSKFTYIKLFRR